jgi:hypothetical protein
LNSKTGLLAEREVAKGGSLSMAGTDFRFLPELKVAVRVPLEEPHLLAEVVLEQAGAYKTAQVEISGREGTATFKRLEALVPTRLKVEAPGYAAYDAPIALVDADKKAVSVVGIGLAKAVVLQAPPPAEAPPEKTGWFIFFLIGVAVAGLISLALGAVSVLAGDSPSLVIPGQYYASVWGGPLLGVVGWWVGSVLATLAASRREGWALFFPLLAWAFLLASLAIARTGRRFLSGSALVAVAATASAGLAFLLPAEGSVFWVVFLFAALALVSSLVGGLMVAFAPVVPVAVPEGKARETVLCPFCGQRKDPVTGACGCEPGQRGATGARLVIEAGERVGETFLLGETFAIGREAGNDLALSDMTVSRRHCVLTGKGGAFFIRDEGSANGTFVNGERITERSLSPGDRLQVGSVVFRFETQRQ